VDFEGRAIPDPNLAEMGVTIQVAYLMPEFCCSTSILESFAKFPEFIHPNFIPPPKKNGPQHG
jgi:hypothetical protein